jgi:hypothetical protein
MRGRLNVGYGWIRNRCSRGSEGVNDRGFFTETHESFSHINLGSLSIVSGVEQG